MSFADEQAAILKVAGRVRPKADSAAFAFLMNLEEKISYDSSDSNNLVVGGNNISYSTVHLQ